MIIVEGADNCGKTSLVEGLLELDPKLKLIKRRRFKPSQSETIGSSYVEALTPKGVDKATHGYGVLDRLLASEIVYGDLMRGGHRITSFEHTLILDRLIEYQAIVIHCDVPDEVILKTWGDREQLYDTSPLEIAHAYRERICEIFEGLVVIKYDWTTKDAARVRWAITRLHQTIQNSIVCQKLDSRIRLMAETLELSILETP